MAHRAYGPGAVDSERTKGLKEDNKGGWLVLGETTLIVRGGGGKEVGLR